MLQDTLHFRTRILEEFGAKGSEIDELLAYNTNVFDHSSLKSGLSLPLKDEPFVPFWEEYAEDAEIIDQYKIYTEDYDVSFVTILNTPFLMSEFKVVCDAFDNFSSLSFSIEFDEDSLN